MTFLRATQDSYDALTVAHLDVVSSDLTDKPLDRALLAIFAEWVKTIQTPFQSRPAQSRRGSRHSPASRGDGPPTEPPTTSTRSASALEASVSEASALEAAVPGASALEAAVPGASALAAAVPVASDPAAETLGLVPTGPVATAEPLAGADPTAEAALVPDDAGPAADVPPRPVPAGIAETGTEPAGVVPADLPTGAGPVADVGCGPGRVTRFLADLGLNAFGIDLSPEMVAIARRENPDLRFDVGSILALNIPDGALTGVLSNYSIINIPWQHRRLVFAEFHRVLAPEGQLMLVFQVGTDRRHYEQVDGIPIDLDFYRQQPEDLKALLAAAGFVLRVSVVREPDADELTPQGYILAQKPVEPERQ